MQAPEQRAVAALSKFLLPSAKLADDTESNEMLTALQALEAASVEVELSLADGANQVELGLLTGADTAPIRLEGKEVSPSRQRIGQQVALFRRQQAESGRAAQDEIYVDVG